jgi:hypothetical protein
VEFDSSQAFSKSPNKFSGQLVTCDPQGLRPHPSYARQGLSVPANRLSALRARRDLAFEEPLTITRDRIIIDGYARWELAKESKFSILHCIEYDLSETEALEWFLQRHRRSACLNAYSRIMLALDLEPELSEKARRNRQIGGQQKGWSNLIKAEIVHVRSEIAKAAAVSVGNITKVKQLNVSCMPEMETALFSAEVSIHWAWKLRRALAEDQHDALGRFRLEKGLLKDVRKLAARRQRARLAAPQDASDLLHGLTQLAAEKLHALRVEVIEGARAEIFITKELARIIEMEQRRLWNQNGGYSNSPKVPESCGPSREFVRRSATI